MTRKDGAVDGAFEVIHLVHLGLGVLAPNALAEEDESTAGPAETLVAGRGYDVGVLERAREHLGGDKTRDMSHVGEHVSVDFVTNFADPLVINESTVCAGTSNDDFGAVNNGKLFKFLVIDESRLLIKTVWHRLEIFRYGRDLLGRRLVAVGKMATMRQIKTHESVVCVHEGRVDVEVGRSSRKS